MGKRNRKVIKAKIAINKMNMLAVLSHVRLFVTLWISLQEYWSGLPFPLQGTFPTQRWNPCLLHLLHCRHILYSLSHLGSPLQFYECIRSTHRKHNVMGRLYLSKAGKRTRGRKGGRVEIL